LGAQEFDPGTLKLSGEPRGVADPVAKIGMLGQMNASVSTGGLLYSATNTVSQFTWLDRAGKPLGVVGEPGEYNTFSLSPDGRRVVVSQDRPGGNDLWLLEVERSISGRFTSNSAPINNFPMWSPDGRTIIFSSGAPRRLLRKDSNGAGHEEPLQPNVNPQLPNDWSRDGRFLLYYEVAPAGRDLWVLPV